MESPWTCVFICIIIHWWKNKSSVLSYTHGCGESRGHLNTMILYLSAHSLHVKYMGSYAACMIQCASATTTVETGIDCIPQCPGDGYSRSGTNQWPASDDQTQHIQESHWPVILEALSLLHAVYDIGIYCGNLLNCLIHRLIMGYIMEH